MTASARVDLQPAFVLHRRPYRETSLLAEAFSADHGRIGLVARGARRGKGRPQALLQPFQPLLLSWSGRGELATLTGVEADGFLPYPVGQRVVSAFYINELLLRLLHRHDPHPELFRCYGETLSHLNGDEWVLRRFEARLLQELGYGLVLDHEAGDGEPIQPDGVYCYHLEHGPVRGEARAGQDLGVSGRTLLALAGMGPRDEQVLHEAKRLLRAALGLYLGDKPLASRVLYRQMAGHGTGRGT